MRDYNAILAAQAKLGHFICLGLDPDLSKIPTHLNKEGGGAIEIIEDFLAQVIDATHDVVQAYKPNFAFFEQYGGEGFETMGRLMRRARNKNSNVLLIGDGKRGDIGNTNIAYMRSLMEFDAFTISPFLGGKTNAPFFADPTKLAFVLACTSNEDAGEFQDLYTMDFNPAEKPEGVSLEDWFKKIQEADMRDEIIQLYEQVAKNGVGWSENVGFVAGATMPTKIKNVRRLIGEDRQLLIPGVGAQGGDLLASFEAGMNSQGTGVTANTSRAALYASSGKDFATACRNEIIRLNTEIAGFRIGKFPLASLTDLLRN